MQLSENYQDMVQLKEAQRILNINRNMIYDLIKSGTLPAKKVGNEWQIIRKHLVIWLEKQNQEASTECAPRLATNSGTQAYYDDWT
jgi:excisionase family DNA binding protein